MRNTQTEVVNVKHDQYNVYIGRGSIWGNPFKIGIDGTRDEVIEKYREHVYNDEFLMSRLHELEGKILGCHCKPKPCHGDILVKLCDSMLLDI